MKRITKSINLPKPIPIAKKNILVGGYKIDLDMTEDKHSPPGGPDIYTDDNLVEIDRFDWYDIDKVRNMDQNKIYISRSYTLKGEWKHSIEDSRYELKDNKLYIYPSKHINSQGYRSPKISGSDKITYYKIKSDNGQFSGINSLFTGVTFKIPDHSIGLIELGEDLKDYFYIDPLYKILYGDHVYHNYPNEKLISKSYDGQHALMRDFLSKDTIEISLDKPIFIINIIDANKLNI